MSQRLTVTVGHDRLLGSDMSWHASSRMSNDTAVSSASFDVLITATLAVTSSTAWLFYTFVWIVTIVYYRSFKNRFYLYIIAAGFSDIGILTLLCLYCVPCIGLRKHIYSQPTSMGALYNFLNQSQVAYMFYVAVNRCSFALSSTYSRYQIGYGSKWKTVWLIVLQFLTSAVVVCVHALSTNGWRFSYRQYAWIELSCPDDQYFCHLGHWLSKSAFIGLPSVASLLYVVMWVVLIWRRRQGRVQPQQSSSYVSAALRLARKREMGLLVQFTFITAVSMVDIVANVAVSVLAATPLENAGILLLDTLNAVANPAAYLIWDKPIRAACVKILNDLISYVKVIFH